MDTLDRKTINLLRGADAITFRWGFSGTAYLEASGSFTPRMTVETAAPKFIDHGCEKASIREVTWVFSSARFHQPLVTFLASLRAGDEIRPIFTADNTSTNLRRAEVTVDEMAVEIIRPRKGKAPQVFHFMLDTQVYLPKLQAYPNIKRAS
jgi:hypothetical protein